MRVVAKFSNTRHKFHRRRHDGIVKFALALAFIISHCPLKIRVQIHASKCCEHINTVGHNLLQATVLYTTINPDLLFNITIVLTKENSRRKKTKTIARFFVTNFIRQTIIMTANCRQHV